MCLCDKQVRLYISIGIKCWIRICTETNGDPETLLRRFGFATSKNMKSGPTRYHRYLCNYVGFCFLLPEYGVTWRAGNWRAGQSTWTWSRPRMRNIGPVIPGCTRVKRRWTSWPWWRCGRCGTSPGSSFWSKWKMLSASYSTSTQEQTASISWHFFKLYST